MSAISYQDTMRRAHDELARDLQLCRSELHRHKAALRFVYDTLSGPNALPPKHIVGDAMVAAIHADRKIERMVHDGRCGGAA